MDRIPVSNHDFGRTSADIDHAGRDTAGSTQKRKLSFFVAGTNLQLQSGTVEKHPFQFIRVAGITDSAGGKQMDGIHLFLYSFSGKGFNAVGSLQKHFLRDLPLVIQRSENTQSFPVPSQTLKPAFPYVCNQHSERIRSDPDGSSSQSKHLICYVILSSHPACRSMKKTTKRPSPNHREGSFSPA